MTAKDFKKKVIWITYALVNNKDESFDYFVQELRDRGLEVRFDRVEIIAGRPLWKQIESNIDPTLIDAFGIFATPECLSSQACLEELSIALMEAHKVGSENFPIIGIFPSKVASEIVPKVIKTRLYVDLTDPDAFERIISAVNGLKPEISFPRLNLLSVERHGDILEFWPKVGVLNSIFALLLKSEYIVSGGGTPYSQPFGLSAGGSRRSGEGLISNQRSFFSADGVWNGKQIDAQIGAGRSGYFVSPAKVSRVRLGGFDSNGNEHYYEYIY